MVVRCPVAPPGSSVENKQYGGRSFSQRLSSRRLSFEGVRRLKKQGSARAVIMFHAVLTRDAVKVGLDRAGLFSKESPPEVVKPWPRALESTG